MREGIDDKAFPEQGAKVSIHSDGSFEDCRVCFGEYKPKRSDCRFYWFTLKRDEPKKSPVEQQRGFATDDTLELTLFLTSLYRFESRIAFTDHIDAATTTHDFAIRVAIFRRTQ
ncbi:hypothetical protein AN414_20240 [Serratia marcescens]|nr:hypothetical protein AN414_20240 [Serratia marcescens]